MKPLVVCVFGPTAVGKTQLLLEAFAGQAEVISADSMQVYRGLDIGTAKPDPGTRTKLPHHLIDIKDPCEQFDVAEFARRAEALIPEIHERGKLPVVSGGTAFYFRALLFGLPETPPSDPDVRDQLERRMERDGPEQLHRELAEIDSDSASRIAPADRYRIVRALEVYHASGRPRSAYRVPDEPRRDMQAVVLGLFRERAKLYRRINRRVVEMMESGLVEEVRGLLRSGVRPDAPGMRGIGYREVVRRLDSELTQEQLDQITAEIQKDSRRYAKRQLTFFRSLPGVEWIDAAEPDAAQRVMRAASAIA